MGDFLLDVACRFGIILFLSTLLSVLLMSFLSGRIR